MRQKTAVLILSRNSDEDGISEACLDMNTADAVSKYSATDDRHVNTDNNAEERRDNTRAATGLTLLILILDKVNVKEIFLPLLWISFELD